MRTGIRMEHIQKAFDLLDQAHQMSITPKGNGVKQLVKSQISKSLSSTEGTLAKTKESIAKSFDLFKSNLLSVHEQSVELLEKNKALSERLSKLESNTPGRKSITTAPGQSFQKSKDGVQDENTYNVNIEDDLSRLSDRLLSVHGKMIEKGNTDSAALIEGTINSIEINKAVPQFAYRPLHQLGIKLVADNSLAYQNHLFATNNNRGFHQIFGTTN